MMWSSGASVWDWLSALLMIIGFTMLLGLSVYLMMSLVHGAAGEPPDDVSDSRPYVFHADERIAS
jgi:hypothetical protein